MAWILKFRGTSRVSAFFYRLRREALGEAAAPAEMESVWAPKGVWVAFVGADRQPI